MPLELSEEQMRVVRHGTPNRFVYGKMSREWVGAPIPDYIKDIKVNWMGYYSNPPHLTIELHDFPEWEKVYTQERRGHFRAYHPDGWLSQLSQAGPFIDREVERFKGYERDENDKPLWNKPIYEKEIVPNCSPKENGFGGAEYKLNMADGQVFTLRGPWHTSPPMGYSDIGTRCDLPGKSGGRMVSNALIYSCLRKFKPDLDIFLVSEYNGSMTSLQPAMPHWNCPKTIMFEHAREAGKNIHNEWSDILGIPDTHEDY